jgi:hypothetical protein
MRSTSLVPAGILLQRYVKEVLRTILNSLVVAPQAPSRSKVEYPLPETCSDTDNTVFAKRERRKKDLWRRKAYIRSARRCTLLHGWHVSGPISARVWSFFWVETMINKFVIGLLSTPHEWRLERVHGKRMVSQKRRSDNNERIHCRPPLL